MLDEKPKVEDRYMLYFFFVFKEIISVCVCVCVGVWMGVWVLTGFSDQE